ncbi:hypothetical protein [Streptomyces sp. NPDC018584]
MSEPEEKVKAAEAAARRIVADAAKDLDDEWTLLQMLGVDH